MPLSRSKGLTLSKCANTIKINNERLGVRRRRTTAGWRDVDEMNIPGSQQDSSPSSCSLSAREVPVPLQKGAECGEDNGLVQRHSPKAGGPSIREPLSASHCYSSYFNCCMEGWVAKPD